MHGSFRVQPDLRAARTTPRLRKPKAETMTDTADPSVEQYEAAIAEANKIVERFRRLPGIVAYRPDKDATPAAVMQWIEAHCGEMTGRTLRKCGHGDFSQPLFITGMEPNLARCASCQDERAAALAVRLRGAGQDMLDCDLCGIPESVMALAVVVFPVAAVVVRAFACNRCLNN